MKTVKRRLLAIITFALLCSSRRGRRRSSLRRRNLRLAWVHQVASAACWHNGQLLKRRQRARYSASANG
jgi:hypothetical protein